MKPPKVITPPDGEPISLTEARAHLEAPVYGDTDDAATDELDDTMILGWLAAARRHCENFLGRSLSPRVLEIALDRFPTTRCEGRTWVELPMGPVLEVLSVTVIGSGDSDGTDATELEEGDYALDDFAEPNRIYPTSAWPVVVSGTNAVRIRYRAGYEIDTDEISTMPAEYRAAVLLVLAHLYKNREDSTEKALQSLPGGAEALMRPTRLPLGMA